MEYNSKLNAVGDFTIVAASPLVLHRYNCSTPNSSDTHVFKSVLCASLIAFNAFEDAPVNVGTTFLTNTMVAILVELLPVAMGGGGFAPPPLG